MGTKQVNMPWNYSINFFFFFFLVFRSWFCFALVDLFCLKWDFCSCKQITLDQAIYLSWSFYLPMRNVKITNIFECLDKSIIIVFLKIWYLFLNSLHFTINQKKKSQREAHLSFVSFEGHLPSSLHTPSGWHRCMRGKGKKTAFSKAK